MPQNDDDNYNDDSDEDDEVVKIKPKRKAKVLLDSESEEDVPQKKKVSLYFTPRCIKVEFNSFLISNRFEDIMM